MGNNVVQSVIKSDNVRRWLMKAVIPAAGLGTRFLPYTKSQPKEMLPVLDKPAIQYVVEEAVEAGIRDITIITGRGKRAIEDHFDSSPELELYLRDRGGSTVLEELADLLTRARISYVRQHAPLGNGHAVLCAESAVGDDSFAVLLGDDLTFGRPPCVASLARIHRKFGASSIAVQRVSKRLVPAYGMVVGEEVEKGLFRVSRIEEKPRSNKVVSNMVTIGRYAFTPAMFRHLRKIRPGRGGEIWLTDGIRSLLHSEDVYAWEFGGRRFDVGTKEGWLMANVELAWGHPDFRKKLRELVKRIQSQPVRG